MPQETGRESGPVTFEPGESAFSREALDLLDGIEQRAWGDAVYGDFPHGADLRMAVAGGFGLEALQEADMRQQAWTVLRDQAAIEGLMLGRLTYAQIGKALGISTSMAHKRYAHRWAVE